MTDNLLIMILASILAGAVTFALVLMLKDMDGPFDIFRGLRVMIGAAHIDKTDNQEYSVESFIGKLFDCHWCLGTWISAAVNIVMIICVIYPWYYFPAVWLAGLTVAGCIYEKVA